jgi:hypothetical protein
MKKNNFTDFELFRRVHSLFRLLPNAGGKYTFPLIQLPSLSGPASGFGNVFVLTAILME